jgi:uncharacterized RDD family membrane protein YckC
MENQNEVQNSTQATVVAGNQPLAQAPGGAPTPSALQPQIRYAGFWIRFVASFIDGLVLLIPQMIVGGLMAVANFGAMQAVAANLASLLMTWAYYIFMTNNYQATLGKKAVGIKVFSTRPENLTLNQVLLRETVGKLVSMLTLSIGYIIAGFTQKKQALHDMIAGTVVIYDPNKKTSI